MFFKIFFVSLIICQSAFCGINSKILENGLRIIYSEEDSNYPGIVMSVFVRGGASLSFNKKTAFVNMAQDYLTVRIKRLSRIYGFRYKTNISWDYTSYVFYLAPSSIKYCTPKIMSLFFYPDTLSIEELGYLKNGAEQKNLWTMNRKALLYPMLSFFAPRQSVYSTGFNGFTEDVMSISDSEFNDFAHCYFSVNNVIVSFAGLKEKDVPFEDAKIYKPCFKDERFDKQVFTPSQTTVTDFSYYKTAEAGFVARLGFLSSSCKTKSILYDVVAELTERDDKINSLADSFYAQNNCYAQTGTIDFIFYGSNDDFYTGPFIKELLALSDKIDQNSLKAAKQALLNNYYSKTASKENLSYLLAKSELTCGDYKYLLDYPSVVKNTELNDVKKALKTLAESKYAYVFMKMGK